MGETIIFYSLDYSYEYSDLQMSIWFIGLMMMIAGLAFIATLSFEIPFAKLEGMLIGAIMGSPSKKTNTTLTKNTKKSRSKEERKDDAIISEEKPANNS